MSLRGHCLCGEVRYEVDAELGPIVACHCSFCRRAHGAAFIPVFAVSRNDFRWLAGEENVKVFTTPGGGTRTFTTCCGTRLFNSPRKFPEIVSLIAETLDEPLTEPPAVHINVESKAPWYEIRDDKPQFPALPRAFAKMIED
jgi:hypothetical protein